MAPRNLLAKITADWSTNAHDPKIRLLLVGYRLSQNIRGPLARPVRLGYRIVSDWILGIDLPWQTQAGPGLRIDHGGGMVIHPAAQLGAGCCLRHGVTIGEQVRHGPVPTIGDRVEFGAHAIVLGDIHVGDGATIGAGAVVMTTVPPGATAVGNPARLLPVRQLEVER